MLGERHAVVLKEHHLQPVAADGVGVDLGGKGVDEADDALGDRVARRGLCAEQEHARLHGAVRVALQLLIEVDNMHRVQKLTLILVQALDLHVEDRVGVEHDALRLFDVGGKIELIRALDLAEAVQHRGVVCIGLELFKRFGVQEVFIPARERAHELVEPRVDLREPAAVVDAVGHIFELLWLHRALVFKNVVSQDVGVQGAHAVHGHAARDAQVCHADLAVPDDSQFTRFGLVVVVVFDFLLIAARDLGDDRPHARQKRLHQLLRPALQCLGKHRVVRVSDGVRRDVPRRVPVEARVIHQDAHELGDNERRVRVVDLNDILFVEVRRRTVDLDVLAHNGLHGRGDEEILLL